MLSQSYYEEKMQRIEAAQKFSRSGGLARARKLSPAHRSRIASNAAKARWDNLQEPAYRDYVPGQVYAS